MTASLGLADVARDAEHVPLWKQDRCLMSFLASLLRGRQHNRTM